MVVPSLSRAGLAPYRNGTTLLSSVPKTTWDSNCRKSGSKGPLRLQQQRKTKPYIAEQERFQTNVPAGCSDEEPLGAAAASATPCPCSPWLLPT